MTVRELREKYLRFFESKGHTIHDSGSLIPIDVTGRLDESLLFNGAGMIQFKPYFLGIATPPNKRLVTAQKCVRTGDIDEVGDDSHLTFFEMMGNFSFGDYFKKEAIAYSWEFLTDEKWLGLDPQRLSFTVFEDDDEAYDCWATHIKAAGIDPTTRIMRLSEETNYWPPKSISKGSPGPCGPNSEMFYWTNPATVPGVNAGDYSCDQWIADDEARNWLEIWNDVFIQFDWQGKLRNPERPSDGWEKSGMPNLPFASIDTGLGLERTVAVLEGKSSVYDTDAFLPILAKIDQLRAGTGIQPPPVRELTDSPFWESDSSLQNRSSTAEQNLVQAEANGPLPEGGGGAQVTRFENQNELVTKVTEGADSFNSRDQLRTSPLLLGEVGERAIGELEEQSSQEVDNSPEIQTARRIIADHIRTSCFCIADGVMPANNGRGYVLRRLIRRAVLKGQRTLGFNDLFMHGVADAVFDTFGGHYKELIARRGIIEETLKSEEALFRRTLTSGFEKLNAFVGADYSSKVIEDREISKDWANLAPVTQVGFQEAVQTSSVLQWVKDKPHKPTQLSGAKAFQLYDTYGFPLEVTQELCAEAGISVDLEGYDIAMKEAQDRSRGAQGTKSAYGGFKDQGQFTSLELNHDPVVYDPYSFDPNGSEWRARITGFRITSERGTEWDQTGLIRSGTGNFLQIRLDKNPIYFESGGQVTDRGSITSIDFGEEFSFRPDKWISGKDWIEVSPPIVPLQRTRLDQHQQQRIDQGEDPLLEGESGFEPTSPHLSEWWDMSAAEALNWLAERYGNREVTVRMPSRSSIRRNHTATHLLQAVLQKNIDEGITQAGSYVGPDNLRFDFNFSKGLTQDQVHLVELQVNEVIWRNINVEVSELPKDEAIARGAMHLFGEKYGDIVRLVEIGEFSKELCGGTHVRTTGEIGLFKITSESSAASGVRRIEAITGKAAYEMFRHETDAIKQAASLLKSSPKDLVQAVERTVDQLKDERKKREKAEMAAMSGGTATNETKSINGVDFYVKNLGDADPKVASQALDNEANGKPKQVTLLAVVSDKVTFMCKVGSDAQAKGAHAGNLLKELARIAGGGGGGQAAFATAGGRDPSKAEEALAAAEGVLAGQIKAL